MICQIISSCNFPAQAVYQKRPLDYLADHLAGAKLLTGKGLGGWRLHLYQTSDGERIVSFRGTANIITATKDVANHFREPKSCIREMEAILNKWESKYGPIKALTGHSEGGLFVTRVHPDRDYDRITFNGHKCKEGARTFNLMLSSDPVSHWFSKPERYLCVGEGGHHLADFKTCLSGRLWSDLQRQAETYKCGETAHRTDVSAGKVLNQSSKVVEKAWNFVKGLDKRDKKLFLKLGRTLYEKGHHDGVKCLKDPQVLGQVLTAGVRIASKTGKEKFPKALQKFVDGLDRAPLEDLIPRLLSLKNLSPEARVLLYKDVLETIKSFDGSVGEFADVLKSASELSKKLSEEEFSHKMSSAAGYLVSGFHAQLTHHLQTEAESRAARRLERESAEEINRLSFRRRLTENQPELRPVEAYLRAYLGNYYGIQWTITEAAKLQKSICCEGEKLRGSIDAYQGARDSLKGSEERVRKLHRQIHRYYQKRMKHRQEFTRAYTFATTVASIACPKVGMAMQVGGMMMDARGEALQERYQRNVETNLRAQQTVQTVLTSTGYGLSDRYSRQRQMRNFLLESRNNIDPKVFREELKKDLEDIKRERNDWAERKKESEDAGEKQRNEAQKLRNKKKKRPDHDSRILEADALAKSYELQAQNIGEQIEELDEQEKQLQEKLRWEEYLAPVREQNWAVVQREAEQFWGGNEKTQQLRKTSYESYWNYNSARNLNRQPMLMMCDAASGLAREFGHLTKSKKAVMTVEMLSQFYRLYDLGRYCTDHALPQLITLGQTEGGAKDVAKVLFSGVGIVQYVVPLVTLVTTAVSCGRLLHGLLTKKEPALTPEQALLESFQKGLQHLKDTVDHHIQGLHRRLGHQHGVLIKELHQQTHDLAVYSQAILDEIGKMNNEIKDEIRMGRYCDHVSSQLKDMNKFRGKAKRKNDLASFKSTIESRLDECISDANHGFIEARVDSACDRHREILPLVDASLMSRSPNHFTGCIAAILGKEGVPNAALYLDACETFLQKANTFSIEEQRDLLDVITQLEKQGAALMDLDNLLSPAIVRVSESMGWFFNLETRLSQFEKSCEDKVKKLVTADKLADFEIVGSQKQRLNRIIHKLPVKADKKALGLNRADNKYKAKIHGSLIALGTGGVAAMTLPFNMWPVVGQIIWGSTVILAAGGNALAVGGRRLEGLDNDYKCGKVRLKGCYKSCEEEILRLLAQSVYEVAASTRLGISKEVQKSLKSKFNSLENVSVERIQYHTEYDPGTNKYLYKVNYRTPDAYRSPKWLHTISGPSCMKGQNSRKLLSLDVTVNLRSQEISVTTATDSAISKNALESIPYPSIEDDKYDEAVQSLVAEYKECLQAGVDGSLLHEDHSFRKILLESYFIPPIKKGLAPLLFPREHLEILYEIMDPYTTQMWVTGKDYLYPSYDFTLGEDGHSRNLVIHFFTGEGTLFLSHKVATFDEATYLGFGTFTSVTLGSGKYDFRQKEPEVNEFLLQMMYTNQEQGLGMPGVDTVAIQVSGKTTPLVAPSESSFPGLWNLLHKNPGLALHYDSRGVGGGGEAYQLIRPDAPTKGKEFSKIVTELRKQLMLSKETVADYRTSYEQLVCLCKWISGLNSSKLYERLDGLGLIRPSLQEGCSKVLERIDRSRLDSDAIEEFQSALNRVRSGERTKLRHLLLELGELRSKLT